jgi:lipid-binding SYLF domain-containing protein
MLGRCHLPLLTLLSSLRVQSAVASFMAAGSLNLGGNMSLAVGPLGRNAEGMGALNTKGKVAAMYVFYVGDCPSLQSG